MLSHSCVAVARRAILVLSLVLALILSTLGPPAPARAVEPIPSDHRDSDVRIQIVIKSIHIFDNRELLGDAEIRLTASLRECVDMDCSGASGFGPRLGLAGIHFGAGFGETRRLSRPFPKEGDTVITFASESGGFPIHADKRYRFHMTGYEDDDSPVFDVFGGLLGDLSRELDAANDWGIGTHVQRSELPGAPGDFQVEYEIRRVPLPDLVPHNLRMLGTDDQQFFCLIVLNEGRRRAEPFQLTISADRELLRTVDLGPLDVNATTEHCAVRSELPADAHTLRFRIDREKQVDEMVESNNVFEMAVPARQAAVSGQQSDAGDQQSTGSTGPPVSNPSPPPTAAAPADLTVSAIRVNGRVPDGKDDCKEGKNAVTVVVKNGGAATAGAFVVRLVVDEGGGQGLEEPVSDLEAGEEREVRFDGVRLEKGEHLLTATIGHRKEVPESAAGNDARKVSLRCKNDD